jgi:hypothetical protein
MAWRDFGDYLLFTLLGMGLVVAVVWLWSVWP